MKPCKTSRLAVLIAAMFSTHAASGQTPPGWAREEVDWRVVPGWQIRGLTYPRNTPPPLKELHGRSAVHRKALPAQARQRPVRPGAAQGAQGGRQTASSVLVIDSPPVDGFVPWVPVAVTGQRLGALEMDAVFSTSAGALLNNRTADYTMGLFDTGASAHVMGYRAAVSLGLYSGFPDKVTSSITTIGGVTGTVDAWVSQPIGVYIGGFDALNPANGALDKTKMLGQYNVAIAVGQAIPANSPDLPTAIGAPLGVYLAAVVDNTVSVSRTAIDGQTYTSPDIRFYEPFDNLVPEHPNYIPLELRPLGAASVQFVPCVDIFGSCPDGDGAPQTPSIIVGNSSQSLYFVSSVDLHDGPYSAIDKTRFMLDTGAQVSVVGRRIAARLGLNPANPEFQVDIQGVDGQTEVAPGFYLDSIDIPALGEWLSLTNVPVIMLDVASPEGGTLDGIIGMNLMLDVNFVLRGGGMLAQPDPSLEFEVIPPLVMHLDFDGDSDVDQDDFGDFQACYTGPGVPQELSSCLSARLDSDTDVDEDDFALFDTCRLGPAITAAANCAP